MLIFDCADQDEVFDPVREDDDDDDDDDDDGSSSSW
jgi:hypothetical protein